MFSAQKNAAPASDKLFVEDVFSTWLYTGNGQGISIQNGVALATGGINGTTLQLPGDSIADTSPVTKAITNNGVTTSTSVKKYGTASLAFTPNQYLVAGTNSDWNYLHAGSDDWTIEFWLYTNSTNNLYGLFSTNVNSVSNAYGMSIFLNFDVTNDTTLSGCVSGSFTRGVDGARMDWRTNGGIIPLQTWTHVAITFSIQTKSITVYVDGVGRATTNTNIVGNSPSGGPTSFVWGATNNSTYAMNVGRYIGPASGGGGYFSGYLDDIRFVRGRRVYTSNFTPPAAALPNDTLVTSSGGMVWTKSRNNAIEHNLIDTVRGGGNGLSSGSAAASTTGWGTTFNSTGYSAGAGTYNMINNYTYASWTFRKAPKFFDVVTYTGTGSARTIAHNLGVAPGCILVKRTDTTADWQVYHRSLSNTQYLVLNSSADAATGTTRWNSTTPTSTGFTVGTDANVNASGGTYVAYLFAHDATSNGIIQCGSYIGNGTSQEINLGWEAQFLIQKGIDRVSDLASWFVLDSMRGISETSQQRLTANNGNAESTDSGANYFTATSKGFKVKTSGAWENQSGKTYIYIAIRRGPMKTPTLGTSVYTPLKVTSSTTGSVRSFGFAADAIIGGRYDSNQTASNWFWIDRLRGFTASTDDSTGNALQKKLLSSTTAAETTNTYPTNPYLYNIWNTTALQGAGDGYIGNGGNLIYYAMRRAPGFFDEVCYTGNNGTQNLNHNLGVVPEMMIVKSRNGGEEWFVYSASLLATEYLTLTSTNGKTGGSSTTWNSTRPTASVFSVGNTYNTNGPYNYVAYLFASCPGVSKVGSYTGNGSSQTINCGFAAGARFVLIKRTNAAGDWYVWDTARGIVAGNDPHLSLNTTSAEVTTDDTIDTDSTGFVVNQVSATNVNVSSATYIYLAIA
jgi:hypothetical protein